MASNLAYVAKTGLSVHNYVVTGSGPTYFTQFTYGKISTFRSRFGNRFCLLIIGDQRIESDFYVVPWDTVCDGFTDSLVHETPRANGHILRRWICHVRNSCFELSKNGFETFKVDVGQYKGNMELLNQIQTNIKESL
ncbi:MAG TPA: hypothetical protein DDZ51_02190 [Planctomycetaceae bacterium]|nr:hypothetical protein [Planctomycetaceae bacterium]